MEDVWSLHTVRNSIQHPEKLDWRNYYGSLNTPHQYHNGGVWPFLGWF